MKLARCLIILLSLSALFSCSSVKTECPPDAESGNPGGTVNTDYNEMIPRIFNNKLYFLSDRNPNSDIPELYYSGINETGYSKSIPDTNLPFRDLFASTSPSFYFDKELGKWFVIFAAESPVSKKKNVDLYYSAFNGDTWDIPSPFPGKVNTEYWESHPAISSDGKLLIFTSDRPGGNGEADLYFSLRTGKNSWSTPENLGSSINTPYFDAWPFLDEKNNLFYSSRGFTVEKDYQILKADAIDEIIWDNPRVLLPPVNSDKDDISPFIDKDFIYLASNRDGGCGMHDIYEFQFCGPVLAELNLNFDNTPLKPEGKVFVSDNQGSVLEEFVIDGSNKLKFTLPTNNEYLVSYQNPCIPDYKAEQLIFAPCSDTSTVKIVMEFVMPEYENEFTFEKYEVPFFVSGYYLPNTTKNLQQLRMKFSYNLIGNSDSTRYIENPGLVYDNYAKVVDNALQDASAFIEEKLNYFTGQCIEKDDILTIEVNGYADPRALSELARYEGIMIDDSEFDFIALRGEKMDNFLLSKLRAYFTAKHIWNRIKSTDMYEKYKDRVSWKIKGMGVDENQSSNELKRRVNIKIGIDKRK